MNDTPRPTARALSVAHAADYLDCSPAHVRQLMQTGQLRYLDIGMGRAKIRIPISDLDTYVEKNLRRAPIASGDSAR